MNLEVNAQELDEVFPIKKVGSNLRWDFGIVF
jgi:hypothetical protein